MLPGLRTDIAELSLAITPAERVIRGSHSHYPVGLLDMMASNRQVHKLLALRVSLPFFAFHQLFEILR